MMADNMFNFKNDPTSWVVGLSCTSLSLGLESWQPFLQFFVMANIKYDQQYDS